MADRVYLEDILIKKRSRLKNKYGLDFKVIIQEDNPHISHSILIADDKVETIPSTETADKESISKSTVTTASTENLNEFRFAKALKKDGLSIIGEVKKASPSKGVIREDFHPIEHAKEYETCVDAISVLTEEDYFLGQDEYLKQISKNVSLPTLCKDFILCKEQIATAKELGASCVLLIVAILTDEQLVELKDYANSLGLDALVEVHTSEEVERALKSEAHIIGINNRDLVTFKTDVKSTIKLRKMIPDDKIVISESGIFSSDEIEILNEVKIHGILVGESFMRADNIIEHSKELKNAYKN